MANAFASTPRTANRGTVEYTPCLDIRSPVRGGYFQVRRVTRGTRAFSGRLRKSPLIDHRRSDRPDLEFVFRGGRSHQTIAIIGDLEATTATIAKRDVAS